MIGDNELYHNESNSIDILIENFTKDLKVRKIPKYVYHGTCTKNIRNILKLGLKPNSGESNFKNIYHENDYIYLSSDITDSFYYATNSASRTKSYPIILSIDTSCIDINNVSFDYDFYAKFIGDGNEYFDDLINKEKNQEKNHELQELKNKYIGSTYRKFSYKKRIPTKYIKYILYMNSSEDEFESYYENNDFDDFLTMLYNVEDVQLEYLIDIETNDNMFNNEY